MSSPLLKFGFISKTLLEENCIEEDIFNIKKWLSTEKLVPLTDEQIVLFLLSCNNDQATTKATIKTYISLKNQAPEIFTNRKISDFNVQKALNSGYMCILLERTEDSCVLIWYSFKSISFGYWDVNQFLKIIFMAIDAGIYRYPPKGVIMIVDIKEMNLSHLAKVRPSHIKIFFEYLQEALPAKLKNIHVLNSTSFINIIVAMIKPVIKKDIFDLINFHPKDLDGDMFYQNFIPKQYLPKDLGGSLPTVDSLHKDTVLILSELEEYFEAEEKQRYLHFKNSLN